MTYTFEIHCIRSSFPKNSSQTSSPKSSSQNLDHLYLVCSRMQTGIGNSTRKDSMKHVEEVDDEGYIDIPFS